MGNAGKLFRVAEIMHYKYVCVCVCEITDILWGSKWPQKFGQVSIKWFHPMIELFSVGDVPSQVLPFWKCPAAPSSATENNERLLFKTEEDVSAPFSFQPSFYLLPQDKFLSIYLHSWFSHVWGAFWRGLRGWPCSPISLANFAVQILEQCFPTEPSWRWGRSAPHCPVWWPPTTRGSRALKILVHGRTEILNMFNLN